MQSSWHKLLQILQDFHPTTQPGGSRETRFHQNKLGLKNKMGSETLCLAQNVGLLISVAGYICSLVTLCIPQWLTFSSGLLENERYMLGLWETCVTQDFRGSVCQGHTTPQNLAAEMHVARILLCVASTTGSIGLVAIFLELACLRYLGCQDSLEKNSSVVGGALFFLAGLTTLVPVSYIAHVTVQRFWGSELPTNLPRWEYGNAMFIGWVGGLCLFTGGLLLILSQLYANRWAEKTISFHSKLDFSRKVPFGKVDFV